MPNRLIRDSARSSPSLAKLSAEAERFFWRLILVADDVGRFDADPRVLLANCFPLLVQKIPITSIRKWRRELVKVGAIRLYEVAGRRYGLFPSWSKHQRVYGSRPKYPEPPATCGESRQAAADSRSYPKTKTETISKRNPNEDGDGGNGGIVGMSHGKEASMQEWKTTLASMASRALGD